jgi:hypothetical protein
MSPRAQVIPVGQTEIYREAFRLLKDWRVILVVIVGVALAVAVSTVLGVAVVAVGVSSRAAARVRSRKREAMWAELMRSAPSRAEGAR